MTTATKNKSKAQLFRDLHEAKSLFILPNAWDASSARIFEKAGFPAIGTTSAGIAASLGYRDGQHISPTEMARSIQQIVTAVDLPVTADIEAGYSQETEEVLKFIEQILEMGVVGINIEDSTGIKENPILTVNAQVKKIKAIRKLAATKRHSLLINARIDVFYLGLQDIQQAAQETLERAHAYLTAGADCIYIFGITDKEWLQKLVQEIPGPVNLLAGAGMPSISELKQMGVRRLSLGSGAMRATLGTLEAISKELLTQGTYKTLTENAFPYPALQTLFS
jgi:2-methylisocitrate lyase-like PEP mutase family enzyme